MTSPNQTMQQVQVAYYLDDCNIDFEFNKDLCLWKKLPTPLLEVLIEVLNLPHTDLYLWFSF